MAAQDGRAPRFDAVLFDFGGTLDADGEPAVEQFHRAYHLAGGRRTRDEFGAIFRESDRRLAEYPGIRRLGFRDAVAAQSALIATLVCDTEHVDASLIAATVHDAAITIARRNATILGELRSRGLRTALVSNFTGNLDCCVAELALAPAFDVVIDSAIVGIRKPDPRIFALALDHLGVDASRALMVGDNPFADIQGAAAAGMSTCWLAPLTRAAPDGCTPTFRIESLSDLPCMV